MVDLVLGKVVENGELLAVQIAQSIWIFRLPKVTTNQGEDNEIPTRQKSGPQTSSANFLTDQK